MNVTKAVGQKYKNLVNQVLAVILQNRPFDANNNLAAKSYIWTTEAVSEILRSIPRFLFQSRRSMGLQKGFRHRSPPRQRNLRLESENLANNVPILGPAARRNPDMVNLGLDKAAEFFSWVKVTFGFSHNAVTCGEMTLVLAKGNRLSTLWNFLREITSPASTEVLVTTSTMTCLIKVLGEEGLVNEAWNTFHRMKQYRCKPDVYAYNTIINALCRVGNFRKARYLLKQMELPGFRCPPDTVTYTILIAAYCRCSYQAGLIKTIRRQLWEANHLFRIMLFKRFDPDVVTYNALINGCCKTYRIERALELLDDMSKRGCVPNRSTYDSFIRYYSAVNEIDKAVGMLRRMVSMNHGRPRSSSYTPVIHALCEAGKALEARDMLIELVDGGSIPREYTYRLVRQTVSSCGESDLLSESMRERIENGIKERFNQASKFKPLMTRKGY